MLRPIGALGSMTLSAYVVHTFLVQDVWTWSVTGHPEREPYVLALIWGVLVIGAVVFARWWGKGPLERGLSWLICAAPVEPRDQPHHLQTIAGDVGPTTRTHTP